MTTAIPNYAIEVSDEESELEHYVKMEMELPHGLLSAILITAFDGSYGPCWQWFDGIRVHISSERTVGAKGEEWYWVKVVELDDAGELNLDDEGNMKVHKVDYAMLAKGIQLILDKESLPGTEGWVETQKIIVQAICDDDGSDIDSDLADTIVQFSIFGKLVFG